MNRPLIAITMGDAAGIGPEVIMKSLAHEEIHESARPLVIGDAGRLAAAGEIAGTDLDVRKIPPGEIETALFGPGSVNCIDLGLIPADLPWGMLSAEAGEAAFRYIETAAKLAMAGRADAICTAPINKEALHAAGHRYPGHTELLAALTGVPEVSMMLTAPNLRVIHVTTHIGLIDAIARIEPGLVERGWRASGSAYAGSTRMRASMASSGTARRRRRSPRRSPPAGRKAGMSKALCRPIRCSSVPEGAISTWWWRCTTTRAMGRSRCSASRPG